MATVVDSETVLDQSGAELLGFVRGRALLKGAGAMVEFQSPFVGVDDFEALALRRV